MPFVDFDDRTDSIIRELVDSAPPLSDQTRAALARALRVQQ